MISEKVSNIAFCRGKKHFYYKIVCIFFVNTPLKSEPLKFEWQWCFLYKSLFYAAFRGRIFYFLIGLENRKMRISPKAQIKTSLSNPLSTIIRFQLFRKSPHIPVLFVRESCVVSLNEVGVCYKNICNHLWHGKMFKNNPV